MHYLLFLSCFMNFFLLEAVEKNYSKDREKKQYVTQNRRYNYVINDDLQEIYAIINNYSHYNFHKKNIANENLWNLKIKNLPLEQKAMLILSYNESSSQHEKIFTLQGIEDFIHDYSSNYHTLNKNEKLNLIKYNITEDKKFFTPEVQKFLRLRDNQITPTKIGKKK